MKDITELAKELADFYGIEYVDAPGQHVVVDADGTEHPLELADFADIFGLKQPSPKVMGVDIAALQSVRAIHSSFNNSASTAKPGHYCTPVGKSRHSTNGNYQYAMAA